MRHSFKSRYDVCHLWAHQLQDSAFCGNVFFEGNTIYSYGTHFPMGRVLENPDGKRLYVLNSNTYSNTTAKYMGDVRYAIPNTYPLFESKGCTAPCFKDGKLYHYEKALAVAVQYVCHIITLMNKQKRARTVDYHSDMVEDCKHLIQWIDLWHLNDGKRWYETIYSKKYHTVVLDDIMAQEIKDYDKASDTFNCVKSDIDSVQICYRMLKEHGLLALTAFSSRQEAYTILDEVMAEFFGTETAEAMKARAERIAKSDRLRTLRRAKQQIKEDKENLRDWHQHERYSWNASNDWFKAYGWHTALHLDKNNENIETSKGITISPEEGKRLWIVIKAFAAGKPFKHDLALDISGSKWAFNKYENDVLFAGCHAIPFTECRRIASLKGWE